MAPKRSQPEDPAEAKKRKADYDRARRVQMTELDKARKAESSRAHRGRMTEQEKTLESNASR
jgi:hypothetical protein